MKLYTEEQVLKALWEKEHPHSDGKNIDEIMKWLAPIELPSDEEIDLQIEKTIEGQFIGYPSSFRQGAKWMRDKILNK